VNIVGLVLLLTEGFVFVAFTAAGDRSWSSCAERVAQVQLANRVSGNVRDQETLAGIEALSGA
jgi:hypothetical protein